MKKTTIPLIIFLAVALVGGLVLVNQNQETRKGATFANTKLLLLPSEKIIKNVGDEFSVKVWYETESGAKVDGVQTVVCYGNELSLDGETGVVANTDNGFESGPIVNIKDTDSGKCATMVATSKKAADKLKTTGEVFEINFTAVSVGEGSFTIDQEKSMVTGDNANSTTDKEIKITGVENTTYQILGGTTGDGPVLNYKISYANVKSGAACVVNWPMQVIVLGGGESKVYSNVIPSNVSASGDILVAKGSLVLTGFNHSSGVAAFFKGPKHLQMKYAVQNQSKLYDKAGGELTLTNDASTSPVYDFTAFPMIPGDVTGTTDGVQDGWIDGIDFSYVKARSLTHETVASGGYIKSDLDGNCQVNSNDVNVLKISLQTKQGQLY
jgi:hypothetical protein